MIYYPLSVLMLARIHEILIITTPHDQVLFQRLLGDGSQWNLKLTYAIQDHPRGLADAFIIGEEFLGDSPCCLILGDNILYKDGLQSLLDKAVQRVSKESGAILFSYGVSDPERYGVVELDEQGRVLSLEEKPKVPKSNQALIGLYFYSPGVSQKAKSLKPSARGELEITDLNKIYFTEQKLFVERLGRGAAWFDMGTHESLLESANFVHVIEKRQGMKIADLDEIVRTAGK